MTTWQHLSTWKPRCQMSLRIVDFKLLNWQYFNLISHGLMQVWSSYQFVSVAYQDCFWNIASRFPGWLGTPPHLGFEVTTSWLLRTWSSCFTTWSLEIMEIGFSYAECTKHKEHQLFPWHRLTRWIQVKAMILYWCHLLNPQCKWRGGDRLKNDF